MDIEIGQRIGKLTAARAMRRSIDVKVFAFSIILKKSSVVALTGLYGRGEVNTPVRIRVA